MNGPTFGTVRLELFLEFRADAMHIAYTGFLGRLGRQTHRPHPNRRIFLPKKGPQRGFLLRPKFTVFEGAGDLRNPNVGSQSPTPIKFCFRSKGWPVLKSAAAMTLRASLSVTTTSSNLSRFGDLPVWIDDEFACNAGVD
jgi:hypothetical protein